MMDAFAALLDLLLFLSDVSDRKIQSKRGLKMPAATHRGDKVAD